MKKQEFKKMRRGLGTSNIFKRSNIRIIWMPEGEEEDQEIENLFEQIMKENFPNLVKEIDSQEVRLTEDRHVPLHKKYLS